MSLLCTCYGRVRPLLTKSGCQFVSIQFTVSMHSTNVRTYVRVRTKGEEMTGHSDGVKCDNDAEIGHNPDIVR